MNAFGFWRSGWRTAPATIFLFAVFILAAGFGIIFQNEVTFRANRDRQAMVAAQVLAGSVTAAVDFGDPVASQQSVDAFRVNPQVRYVGVFDRAGHVLGAYDPSRGRARLDLAKLPPPPGSSYRVSVPVTSAGQRIGTAVYEVEREAVSRRLTRYVVMGALAVMAALVIATLGLAQNALRRANRELSERAEALSQSNELLAEQIEERAKAEDQLRQSQKMQALGQLTGGIAHDFNNLLTVVVGGLDVVSRRVEDEKLKRYAVNALAAAERGARLTGQLLAFSRVQRLEVRPVEVGPLIQNIRPLLRNVLGPGIAKEFDLDDIDLPVMADPTQLEVAVLNLAINARDAMPKGGLLKFSTQAVRIAGDAELSDGDYVVLAISDTGTGMDEAVASRAFEPFFTTKEIGKGTGLGLSMVYGMARQSGGTARIESIPGEGTAIKLFFKAATDKHSAASARVEESEPGKLATSASILVIDDDPDVRAFIAEALAEEGFRVRDCGDGLKGLEEFESDRPDLVVLDFVMPAMSGAEVASRMLGEAPDQKILFVSGYSETDAIKSIAPQSPLLPKPFRSDALCRAVRNALS
jgi:signal transduction histidine kinase